MHCKSWREGQFVAGKVKPGGLREGGSTWYLVRRVLHTPVTSIMVIRKGMTALLAMFDREGMMPRRWRSGEL